MPPVVHLTHISSIKASALFHFWILLNFFFIEKVLKVVQEQGGTMALLAKCDREEFNPQKPCEER